MKMDISEIVARIDEILTPLLNENGRDLVMIQYRRESHGWVLRLFVDKLDGNGITVDELAATSKIVGPILETEPALAAPYSLEVSSPGIERPLAKREHFERFAGREATINLAEDIDGRRNFNGTLRGVEEDLILIEEAGGLKKIPMNMLKKANLKYVTGAK